MCKKTRKNNKTCKVSIGGQAVLEGVMMRSQASMATAVRDADGIIRVETKRLKPAEKQSKFLRLPIVRGVVSFISSMFGGTATLMRSAEVYGEGEPSKFEKWLAKKTKINIMSIVGFISLVIGLALAVGLFVIAPQYTRKGIETLVGGGFKFNVWARNFIEGGLKLLIFLSYILFCSLIKDVKRTFMYHGAEHKTISCFEKGLELTPENAKTCTRLHDRCGTTFIFIVMMVSILAFACFESLVGAKLDGILRVLCKIALLPLVSGISYEILKLLSKTKSKFFLIFKAPGLLMQKITTKEPDEKMLEVAITAFKAVMEMDADPSIKEQKFITPKKRCEVLKDVKEQLDKNEITEQAEAEWIVSIVLGVKRDELNSDNLVSPKQIDEINEIIAKRKTGRPLWYCIGDTEFYGYKIKVDERVLIPRCETELLVEQALKIVDKDSKVLDLCTGSGAIAIAINKEKQAILTAVDVSEGALDVATINAKENGAIVEFINSDLFGSLGNRKFDVIISNPPYIPTKDIDGLQREVKDFEPKLALDGGEDGLDFYKNIILDAPRYLNEKGVLLFECGIGQAQAIKDLLKDFSSVEIIKDYENIDRIVKAVL